MKVTGQQPSPLSPLGEPRTRPAPASGQAPADAGHARPARLGGESSIGHAPRRAHGAEVARGLPEAPARRAASAGASVPTTPHATRAVRFDLGRNTTHEFVRGPREDDPSPYIRNPAPRRHDAAPRVPGRTPDPTPPASHVPARGLPAAGAAPGTAVAARGGTARGETPNDAPLRRPTRSSDPDVGP